MFLSKIFYPSLKEIPKDAVIKSHILMLRAGLIRKLASGFYSYFPLGYRSFRKIAHIVREEMTKADAQEFSLPIPTPAELWEKTGRWQQFGPELLRITDRHQNQFALGPTHEEVFTYIVKNEISSYKQLPVTFYQMKTKFRDEIRPRYGVMRGREFTMKDAYSFDFDDTSLEKSYNAMRQAYSNIFKRCGLDVKIVSADTGSMGGAASEEFMVESSVGEDVLVFCSHCDYASNLEKATAQRDFQTSDEPLQEKTIIDTPNIRTIEELTNFLKTTPKKFIKTLIYKYKEKPVVVLIRGDLDVNETKLLNVLGGGEIELANEDMVYKVTNAPVGFAGPIGLKNVKIIADESVQYIVNGITGANIKDKHYMNVNLNRDFKVDNFFELNIVKEGDLCPHCGKPLQFSRGIEVGHIFKLGKKYTESIGVSVLDQNGKAVTPTMGCYGIGIDRTLAAVIEQYNDNDGIIFPISVAPFEVIIVPIDFKDEQQRQTALNLYHKLEENKIEVLLDDRKLRPGFKFKDADLLGIPIRVTIGPKFLKENKVEVKLRNDSDKEIVALDSVESYILDKTKKLWKEVSL